MLQQIALFLLLVLIGAESVDKPVSSTVLNSSILENSGNTRLLTRNYGKRWKHLHELAKAEIKSATQSFLRSRGKHLLVPLQVDVILIGFGGSSAYGYSLPSTELEAALKASTTSEVCPAVWDSGEEGALCYDIRFDVVELASEVEALHNLETRLRSGMKHVALRSDEKVGASTATHVFEVEASELEPAFEAFVQELSISRGAQATASFDEMRPTIFIINPHKLRMNPLLSADEASRIAMLHHSFVEEWKSGNVSLLPLIQQEGGYIYRYVYAGAGGSAAWISSSNYAVIDISAGPVSLGPAYPPTGGQVPVSIPRLQPLMLRLAHQLDSVGQTMQITFKTYMTGEAAAATHSMFVGQLAVIIHSAARHLFAPDLRSIDLPKADRIMVPVVHLRDHDLFEPFNVSDIRGVDISALNEVLGGITSSAASVLEATSAYLHNHRTIASALHKAKISASESLLVAGSGYGTHEDVLGYVDGDALLRELLRSADTLTAGLMGYGTENTGVALEVLPVYVLSLARPSPGLLMEGRTLVTSGRKGVVVMQLLAGEAAGGTSSEPLDNAAFSGHLLEDNLVYLNTEDPMVSIVAGLANLMAGLVPPYTRLDTKSGKVMEDWRWCVGAQPWGPHTRYPGLSALTVRNAQRNLVVARVEAAIREAANSMKRLEDFADTHISGPFADVIASHNVKVVQAHGNAPYNVLGQLGYAQPGHRTPISWVEMLLVRTPLHNATGALDLTEDGWLVRQGFIDSLRHALGKLEEALEDLAYQLFSGNWQKAEVQVEAVKKEAGHLSLIVNTAVDHLAHVSHCCDLHHQLPGMRFFTLIISAMVIAAVIVVALLVVLLQSIKGIRTRRGRSESLLPTWA